MRTLSLNIAIALIGCLALSGSLNAGPMGDAESMARGGPAVQEKGFTGANASHDGAVLAASASTAGRSGRLRGFDQALKAEESVPGVSRNSGEDPKGAKPRGIGLKNKLLAAYSAAVGSFWIAMGIKGFMIGAGLISAAPIVAGVAAIVFAGYVLKGKFSW